MLYNAFYVRKDNASLQACKNHAYLLLYIGNIFYKSQVTVDYAYYRVAL